MKKMKLLIACIFAGLWFIPCKARGQTWPAKLNLASLFYMNANYVNGIKGTVGPDGYIRVTVRDTRTGSIIYRISTTVSTPGFAGEGEIIQPGAPGSATQYYPPNWNSTDIRSAAFALDKDYAGDAGDSLYHFLNNPMPVQIVVESSNASLQLVKIPGIGPINAQGGNDLFDPLHYCYDLQNTADCQCTGWLPVKQPDITKNSDVVVAAHRGIWGYDLGNANPENSVSSIAGTPPVTAVLESDVMIMEDGRLIVSHDYNLDRLSNYTGPSTDYLFNMNYNQVKDLLLRKRNEAISNDKYLDFDALVQELVRHKLVLTIDIKDIRARYDAQGNCVAACEYDPRTPEGKIRVINSWKEIFRNCISIAKSHHALSYIAFKTPHDFDTLRNAGVPESDLAQVLYMPVIQPNNRPSAVNEAVAMINSWNSKAGNRVLAYETNFKTLSAPTLQPFVRDGVHYQNILNYVYARTGLRPGCYPEEPMGPRGIVNRWAEWFIKDLGRDIRGDHYALMSIPYGKIMVLTTDRPDVWEQIQAMYNRSQIR